MVQTNVSSGEIMNEFGNWCELHNLAALTPKTYVTLYSYLFLGNSCGLGLFN